MLRRAGGSRWGLLPAFVGLSSALVLDNAGTGLEAPYTLLVLTAAVLVTLEFHAGRCGALPLVMLNLLVYVTRPDAILLQAAALAVLALPEPRRYAPVALLTVLGLVALLVAYKLYYGTSLPLAFYLKTRGLTQQYGEHMAVFAREKTKNVVQFLLLCAPFVLVASYRRAREVSALLAAAALFVAYHYLFTIEQMGHCSRYYMPALTFVLCAAALGFDDFRSRASARTVGAFAVAYGVAFLFLKTLDNHYRVDIMIAAERDMPVLLGILLLLTLGRQLSAEAGLAICVVLVLGTALVSPIEHWGFASDRRILLKQIEPRRTFRGLDRLRRRIPEAKAVFHHDMGAPGVLFPEARVVDLDGLLNEQITLHGARFEQLCRDMTPEAIFVPSVAYPALRSEVLSSECLKSYRRIDARPDTPLRVREDLYARYMAGAP
jgi:hypothetical protein